MIPDSKEIRFEPTTKCNYNCVICPREKLTRKQDTMSLEDFKFLFDKVRKERKEYNTVTFSGFGEPFLDPSLFDKIRCARKKNFEVLILTNASLLTKEKFLELDRMKVKSVRISFYGYSPEVYSSIHGINQKGLFDRIKDTLTEISDIKKHTKLILTLNIEKGINGSEMKSWIDYWKDKADLLEVWRPHNWIDGRRYRRIQRKKLKTCGRPWKTPLQVQVDGTVNMCCFDFDGKLILGDLKSQSLKEIFSSPMFKKILKHHTSGNFKNSGLICEFCDQRNADKSDVMLYNSKFDIKERVAMVSTIYSKLL